MRPLVPLLCLVLAACQSVPASQEYSGVYRRGFEQSMFLADDGGGPYWLTAGEADWTRIGVFEQQRPGRGSFTAVRLKVRGRLTPFDLPEDVVAKHAATLAVEEILLIEPIADEVFQTRLRAQRTR